MLKSGSRLSTLLSLCLLVAPMITATSKSLNESLYSLVGANSGVFRSIWLRFPATQNGGFHKRRRRRHVHSARFTPAGGLRLVDTLRLKAPGSFFLVAGVLRVFGDFCGCQPLWLLLRSGLRASIFVRRLMFGSSAGWVSAHFCTFSMPITDSIDIKFHGRG